MRAIEFLKDYFTPDEYFIIAQKHPSKNGKVKHHHTMLNIENKSIEKHLGRFYYLNKEEQGADIYFTLNTYKVQTSRYPKRTEEFVDTIKSFYFDIDKGDIESKKTNIINLCGTPTYIIQTSKGKFQFIYKFKEPYVVKNKEDRDNFKQLLKGLTYHFDVDKTFDTARIFRLSGYMNKKPQNENFIVKIKKFENLSSFEEFEKIAKEYTLEDTSKKKTITDEAKTPQKPTLKIKVGKCTKENNFKEYEGITKIPNRKYYDLLKKYNDDYSITDLAFARWLRYSKYITDDEVIIQKIFQARGYNHLMKKHSYQIDYYFENILEKSKY